MVNVANDLRVPLPEELEPFRADLEYFFSTMVRKLHVNRHKGTSKILDVDSLVKAIRLETDELEKAIREEGQFDAPLEACDVANFAFLTSMAIWHMTRKDFDEQRKKQKSVFTSERTITVEEALRRQMSGVKDGGSSST